jgi:glycosyltransferase involved in cell wall biosynthesis
LLSEPTAVCSEGLEWRRALRVCVITLAGYLHGIGGMQDHTSNLVRGLVKAGHDVEVITRRHPDGLPRACHLGATWHFVDAPAWAERIPRHHPEWTRKSTTMFVVLHGRQPFDVVHSESTSALGLLRSRLHWRVPVVAKFHGNYLSLAREIVRRGRMTSDLTRAAKDLVWTTGRHFLTPGNVRLFRACEAMVPSRTQLDDTCRSHFLERTRVHVVPNGIDTEWFSPGSSRAARAALGVGAGTVFVTVGRINRGKGVRNAIEALALLPSDTRLLVVGDGEEREALERHARDMGLRERVTFTGAVAPEQVPLYLQAADGFVFPTLLPEAAGLSLLQAMSCGLSVVASRVGAIPEIVGERNAVLVPPGDVGALAVGMRTVAEDPALRKATGDASRRRVLAEFTIPKMVERTIDVYEVAIRAQGAHGPARVERFWPS